MPTKIRDIKDLTTAEKAAIAIQKLEELRQLFGESNVDITIHDVDDLASLDGDQWQFELIKSGNRLCPLAKHRTGVWGITIFESWR